MNIAQQIVGVNERLGNFAVPEMQGTTRLIYDSFSFGQVAVSSGICNFFQNVQAKIYPDTNVSQNRFEVGESLAIQGFAFGFTNNSLGIYNSPWISLQSSGIYTAILNFYIGNQRIIKDLDLMYGMGTVGKSFPTNFNTITPTLYLETPIIIPPQIEFYATVSFYTESQVEDAIFILTAFGTGTLLNTKENF